LLQRKRQIEKDKAYRGNEYHDYNLVFCFEDGRPVEPKRCAKWFQVWQERTGLDLNTIVFHGIRHSAATYFLGMSEFDVKTVRDITGHGTTAQLTDGYAHKVREHKKELMERFASGSDFYGGTAPDKAADQSVDTLLTLLQNDPSMREKVLLALGAQKDIITAG
jgi:hypothetical protein